MASKRASSTSRRSVSGVRQENSASSLVPCVVHAGDVNDAVAPRCFCGVYAIMYMSRTVSNPNRIFLGCPFYNGKEPHCKFFVWVDEHLARIGSNGCISDKRHLGEIQIEVVEEKEELDHRMAVLEEKIIALEKKKNPLAWCIGVIICAVCVAIYVSSA
ncbi:hypothetical protein Ahy_B09g098148 [Arachis hypogaea]|uniref:GRF-type domain-containing protein n=1 Tax=Arachis hypogaea TaxID=3818 RepID=A0A444XR83_ARAHY|nr:hypothetical protein Ahy_B09g098148 [Arachis hypogaea]